MGMRSESRASAGDPDCAGAFRPGLPLAHPPTRPRSFLRLARSEHSLHKSGQAGWLAAQELLKSRAGQVEFLLRLRARHTGD